MANERLRDALMGAGFNAAGAAQKLGVDTKTVERWMARDNRTPYAKHRSAIAALVGQSESYLWPAAVSPERQVEISAAELIATYPHRNSVPSELWDDLLDRVVSHVDILVHAGLFLTERPSFIQTLLEKASSGVKARINFGDPDSDSVELRSSEEQLGRGVLGARIRYGLAAYRPLIDTPGIEFRFHEATLYNSIFRFDDEMIVNAHIYSVPGAHAPALYLRRLASGELFETYIRSFDTVWDISKSAEW